MMPLVMLVLVLMSAVLQEFMFLLVQFDYGYL
jgi:hypothetical protein